MNNINNIKDIKDIKLIGKYELVLINQENIEGLDANGEFDYINQKFDGVLLGNVAMYNFSHYGTTAMGSQRDLNLKRAREIAANMKDEEDMAILMHKRLRKKAWAIKVSFDLEALCRDGDDIYAIMPLDEEAMAYYAKHIKILDGQHRLASLSDELRMICYDSYNVSVFAYTDTNVLEDKEIFFEENGLAKSTPANMNYAYKAECGKLSTEEQIIYEAVKELSDKIGSVLHANVNYGHKEGRYNLLTMAAYLNRTHLKDEIVDRLAEDAKQDARYADEVYFESNEAQFLHNYLTAVQEVYCDDQMFSRRTGKRTQTLTQGQMGLVLGFGSAIAQVMNERNLAYTIPNMREFVKDLLETIGEDFRSIKLNGQAPTFCMISEYSEVFATNHNTSIASRRVRL